MLAGVGFGGAVGGVSVVLLCPLLTGECSNDIVMKLCCSALGTFFAGWKCFAGTWMESEKHTRTGTT
uniref:Putative secreted protein n=1 Tax=Anopheles triannulatus TaxID=58253 RepID=A0A2M4B5U0_9DIPT